MQKDIIKIEESGELLVQQNGYQKFAKNYDRLLDLVVRDYKYRKKMVSGLNLKKGDSVLIVACGTGRDFELVLQSIGKEGSIVAVDLTAEMLQQARLKIEKNHWKNVELVCTDVSEIKLDTKFDAAICSFAMSVIPDYQKAFLVMMKSVKAGGSIGILDVKRPHSRFLFKLFHSFIVYFMPEYNETRPVIEMMKNHLGKISIYEYFFGYIFIACGEKFMRE